MNINRLTNSHLECTAIVKSLDKAAESLPPCLSRGWPWKWRCLRRGSELWAPRDRAQAPAQSKDTAHPEQVAAHTPLPAPASPDSSPQRQTPLEVFEVLP